MGRHAGIRGIRARGVRLPADRAAEIWESFLEALKVMSAIEASKLPDMPSSPAFIKKRKRDPGFNLRASLIIAERNLNNSGRKRITAAAWRAFLNDLGSVCVKEICSRPGMPSEAAVYKRRKLDPSFDKLFTSTFRERRTAAIQGRLFARFPGMRRLYDRSQDRDRSHQESAPEPSKTFQQQLSESDLYRKALAAVPSHINPNDRSDIASDIVLAVLEGRFSIDEAPARSIEFQRAHWRMFGTIGRISIDARRFDDSDSTIGDTISNEHYQNFLAEAAR